MDAKWKWSLKILNYINLVTPNSKPGYNAIPVAKIREAAADSLLMGIAALIFHVNTPESGYLVETVLQSMPTNTFDLLAIL